MFPRSLGLPEAECDLVAITATLHDIGKIAISDSILLKPERLTITEFNIMKTHSEIGAKLLEGSQSELLRAAQVIALSHHERWDGLGYPNQLKGPEIPLYGRIVALCDVYDALSSVRPYKEAWDRGQVEQHINALNGKQFDPLLVQHFNERRDEFYSILKRYED